MYSIGTPYNWMFTQSLTRTQHGKLNPNMMFSHYPVKYNITRVMDFGMDTLWVLDLGKEAWSLTPPWAAPAQQTFMPTCGKTC